MLHHSVPAGLLPLLLPALLLLLQHWGFGCIAQHMPLLRSGTLPGTQTSR